MQTVALSALLLAGQATQDGTGNAGLVDAWLKVSLDHAPGFHWHCGFAAFSDYALRAELDGQEIWKVGRYPHRNNKEPHWLNGQFRLARLPETKTPSEENE